MRCAARLLLFAGLLAVATGCQTPASPGRVIVLGLDGIDPEVVDLLLSEGELPNFARMRREGAYGRLQSQKPLLSPVVWTTIATGKSPLEHGISHFVAVNPKTGAEIPVTSRMRRVKAVWNVLSDAGQSVGVVGWWATWPAEALRGAVVSDHTCFHFLFDAGSHGSSDPAGVTHPPELLAEISPFIRRPGDLAPEELARFVDVDAEARAAPFDFRDDLSHFKWALATAETYRTIGLHLWQARPDVLLVYVEGVDSTSHLFGHLFRAGPLSGELAAQQARYGRAAEERYRYADEIVGSFLDALDGDDTLIVLSDHGFELGKLHDDPSRTRDLRRVSERFHRIDGIVYLYGGRVRAARRLHEPSILDVAPSLLALRGIAPPADMPGRVWSDVLRLPDDVTAMPRAVASYESEEPRAPIDASGDVAEVDAQVREHLASLGYLDASSPKGDRNLAALRFEAGDYTEAARLYGELVRANPDDAGLRASHAGALGALGRSDESLDELTKSIVLDPANPEAHHNRGVLLEAKSEREAAIRS